MREQRFIAPLLLLVGGLLVWAAHFAAVYAINALACARGFAGASFAGFPAVSASVVMATLVAAAVIGAIALAAWSGGRLGLPDGVAPRTVRFFDRIALAAAAISLLGVVWNALPVFLIPPCG